MHGVLHASLKDKTRFAMPPILTVFVASLLFFFHFMLGHAAFGVLAGFVFRYASYLLVHYGLHVYTPPKNALKRLWHHHALHHYSQKSVAFGVCTTQEDHVFGTCPVGGRGNQLAYAGCVRLGSAIGHAPARCYDPQKSLTITG